MKKLLRGTAALLLAGALFAASAVTALAADQSGNAALYLPDGANATIEFVDETKKNFFKFENVIPGDTLTQDITIQNRRNEAVNFYINAQENTSDNEELLRLINLTITDTRNNNVVYSGNLTGRTVSVYGDMYQDNNTRQYGINLGNYAANSTATLRAVVHVPVTVDNDHADDVSRIIWQVRAQMPDPASSSSSSSSSSRRSATVLDEDNIDTTATITEEDVPLAGDMYKIPDDQVPLVALPKTGGGMSVVAFVVVSAIGAAALFREKAC